jgi:hypothetical protein
MIEEAKKWVEAARKPGTDDLQTLASWLRDKRIKEGKYCIGPHLVIAWRITVFKRSGRGCMRRTVTSLHSRPSHWHVIYLTITQHDCHSNDGTICKTWVTIIVRWKKWSEQRRLFRKSATTDIHQNDMCHWLRIPPNRWIHANSLVSANTCDIESSLQPLWEVLWYSIQACHLDRLYKLGFSQLDAQIPNETQCALITDSFRYWSQHNKATISPPCIRPLSPRMILSGFWSWELSGQWNVQKRPNQLVVVK